MDGLRAPEKLTGAEMQRNDTLVRVPMAVTVGVPGNAMIKRGQRLGEVQQIIKRARRALNDYLGVGIPAAVQTDVKSNCWSIVLMVVYGQKDTAYGYRQGRGVADRW